MPLASLRGPRLADHRTGPALRYAKNLPDMIDQIAPPRGAYGFPRKASDKIILSSVRSETARRSRAFSASTSFSPFT